MARNETKLSNRYDRVQSTSEADLRIVDSTAATVSEAADQNRYDRMLHSIQDQLQRIETMLRVFTIVVAQTADPTHISIEGAAHALGVSVKTIRRRIASGALTLEVIPGSRKSGIRIDEVYDGWWVPIAVARRLLEEEKRDLDKLKENDR